VGGLWILRSNLLPESLDRRLIQDEGHRAESMKKRDGQSLSRTLESRVARWMAQAGGTTSTTMHFHGVISVAFQHEAVGFGHLLSCLMVDGSRVDR